MYNIVPVERINRWFEIHIRKYFQSRIEQLKKLTIPIYMQEVNPEIPTSVKYPLDEIILHFNRRYFKSTLDFMIALALYEGFEEIHIYGVNMAMNDEYSYQKPSMEYWLGRAEGMGVKIILPDGCDLLKEYFRYGYDDEKEKDLKIKAQTKSAELDKQSKEFMKNYYLSLGAKDTWDFILREIGC